MSDHWMRISVTVPADDGDTLLLFLRERFGFTDVDWCEMQRADRARVMYSPTPPLTDSGLTIDPFPPS